MHKPNSSETSGHMRIIVRNSAYVFAQCSQVYIYLLLLCNIFADNLWNKISKYAHFLSFRSQIWQFSAEKDESRLRYAMDIKKNSSIGNYAD